MAIQTNLRKSWAEISRRVNMWAYFGESPALTAPNLVALNGESILVPAYTATQPTPVAPLTGTIAIIGTDGTSANNVILPNGATIPAGQTFTNLGTSAGSVSNGLTALAGGGQTGATPLPSKINRVTTVATAADSVLLPLAVAGTSLCVINAAAANAMNVFPQTGQFINALAVNTAFSVAANKVCEFFCAVNGTWNSQLSA